MILVFIHYCFEDRPTVIALKNGLHNEWNICLNLYVANIFFQRHFLFPMKTNKF